MKNIIKGLIDQGHEVSIKKSQDMYIFDLNDKQWTISFSEWQKAEEILLDFIINDADL